MSPFKKLELKIFGILHQSVMAQNLHKDDNVQFLFTLNILETVLEKLSFSSGAVGSFCISLNPQVFLLCPPSLY